MNDPTTDRHSRSTTLRNISIASAVAVLAVIVPAVATWAGDRSELKTGTSENARQDGDLKAHQAQIDQLRIEQAARSARDEDLRRTLDRLQNAIDKIADRVGASKP